MTLVPLDPPDGRTQWAFEHAGRYYAVFDVGGELHVTDNACPHHGGPLADVYYLYALRFRQRAGAPLGACARPTLAHRRTHSVADDWRSSVDVVCSRILRHARVGSRSASKCLTTLRTRVAEIWTPWRSHTRLKRA